MTKHVAFQPVASTSKARKSEGSSDDASVGSSEDSSDDGEGVYEVEDEEEEQELSSDSDGEGAGARHKGVGKYLSQAELQQLAQGPEDVVEDLDFSDEDAD